MKYTSKIVADNLIVNFIENDRKLFIDINEKDSKEYLKIISDNDIDIKRLINKFDIINAPYTYKKITLKELLDYQKVFKLKYYIKILIDFLDRIDKYKILNKILLVLFPTILYGLGYLFLYGFYISKDSGNGTSLISIITNPIPFNFKSIITVGGVFLLSLLMQYLPILREPFIKNEKERKVYIAISLLGILISFIVYCQVFMGGFDVNKINAYIYLLFTVGAFPIITLCGIKYVKYIELYPLKFSILMFYSLLIMFSLFINKWISEPLFSLFIFLSVYVIPPLITSLILSFTKAVNFLKNKKYRNITYFFSYALAIYLFIRGVHAEKKYLILIIMLSITIGVFTLIFVTPYIIKFHKKYIKKHFKKKTLKSDSNKLTKNKYSLSIESKYSLLIVFLVSIFLITLSTIPHLTISFGRLVRYSITDEPLEKIYFTELGKGDKVNVVIGNVIAQKGNSYYISQYPKRTLLTVESNNIRRLACDDFIFANNFNNFNIDKNDLIEKYKIIFQENNLKLEQTELVNNIDEYSSDYSQEIFIYSDSTKEIYDWKMDFNINYELYDDGKIKSFKIEYKSSYNKDSNELKNEELRKEIDNIMINIKRITKDYFHLPTFSLERDTSYYTNGLMDYRLYKSEYLTNSLVEEYYFKPYNNN